MKITSLNMLYPFRYRLKQYDRFNGPKNVFLAIVKHMVIKPLGYNYQLFALPTKKKKLINSNLLL